MGSGAGREVGLGVGSEPPVDRRCTSVSPYVRENRCCHRAGGVRALPAGRSTTTSAAGASQPGAVRRSSTASTSASGVSYGGSQHTRWNGASAGAVRSRNRTTSPSTTRPASANPVRSRLRPQTPASRRSRSTRTARPAPRESASIAIAPVPAKRSSTTAPDAAGPTDPNTASRTRSAVGLVVAPAGDSSRNPPARPATTRSRARAICSPLRLRP